MPANDDLGLLLAELQRKIEILERAAQAQHSTVETGGGTVALGDAVTTAVDTAAALPGVEEQAVTAQGTADSVAVVVNDWDDELDDRLEAASADLDNATADLEDAQGDVRDAFGQQLTDLSDKVDQIVVGAGGALLLFADEPPSDDQAPAGSTWWLLNEAKNIVGQWQQTGTDDAPVWTPRAIESDIIANLDVGKLSAGQAAIAQVVALKIAASTASIQTVNVENLFVTSGATMKQAVIDYLFANVVAAKKITTDMLDVNSFNGVTVTGAIIKTAATGKRVELSGTSLTAYGDGANVAATVDAYTGNDGTSRLALTAVSKRPDGTFQPGSFTVEGSERAQFGSDFVDVTARATGMQLTGLLVEQLFASFRPITSDALPSAKVFDTDVTDRSTKLASTRFSYLPAGVGTAPKTPVEVIGPMPSNAGQVRVRASDFQLPDGTSISSDTGWVTSGFTVGSSNVTVGSFKIRAIGSTVIVVVDPFTLATLSVPVTGDIGNQVILQVPSAFRPSQVQELCSGSTGPVATGYINGAGNIVLAAIAPDATQTGTVTRTNAQFSLGGSYFLG